MALLNDYTLVDGDGANVTFTLMPSPGNGVTRRLDVASTASAPREILIGHQVIKRKDTVVVDRTLVGFRHVVINPSGIAVVGIINTTYEIPRDPAFTDDHIDDLDTLRKNFLVISGMRVALLQGQS